MRHQLIGCGLVEDCWIGDVDDGGESGLLSQFVGPAILQHSLKL
jgi:hypothetical protein